MAEVSLTEVAAAVGARLEGDGAVRVRTVTHDSGAVGEAALFCCVPGARHDGHDFAEAALAAGAVALLCSRRLPLEAPQILVPDVRAAMGPVAAEVYGHPSAHVSVVGVTGTNGKTTWSPSWPRCSGGRPSLRGAGHPHRDPDHPGGPRAPGTARGVDGPRGRRRRHGGVLARPRAAPGRRHPLPGRCVHQPQPDHLDFHGTLEAYFEAKARLFEPDLCEAARGQRRRPPRTPPRATRRRSRPWATRCDHRGPRLRRAARRSPGGVTRSACPARATQRGQRAGGRRGSLAARARGCRGGGRPGRRCHVPGRFELVDGPPPRSWSTTPTPPTPSQRAGHRPRPARRAGSPGGGVRLRRRP